MYPFTCYIIFLVVGSSLIMSSATVIPFPFRGHTFPKQREIAGREQREDTFCDAFTGHVNHRWKGQQRQRETMVSKANEYIRVSRLRKTEMLRAVEVQREKERDR